MGDKGKELADKLIALKSEGKVAFETFDGLYVASIEDLIYKQPVDGLLYDLNRDAPTCLTWIEQEKESWVNNYAAGLVIEKLYADVLSARAKYEAMQKALEAAEKELKTIWVASHTSTNLKADMAEIYRRSTSALASIDKLKEK